MVTQPTQIEARHTRASPLSRTIKYLSKADNSLTGKVGAAISGTVLASMMFLTIFDVAGRYFLNKPIVGSMEITEYGMALLVAFSLGYCALEKGHIRVDLLMQFTSRKVNLWMDVFAYGVSSVFYIFLTWQSWLHAWKTMGSHLTSPVLAIPVYPFIFMVTLGAALLVLILLRDFLQSIHEALK